MQQEERRRQFQDREQERRQSELRLRQEENEVNRALEGPLQPFQRRLPRPFVPEGVMSQVRRRQFLIEAAAPQLKMRVTPIELRRAADLEPAFKRGAALGVHAYMTTMGPLHTALRPAITDRLLRAKAAAISVNSEDVEAGYLMSYGPIQQDNFRRAAGYVHKIFKGAKPGELPIEQPVKFELVINMKTAKAMGFKIPQSILVRADRVIE